MASCFRKPPYVLNSYKKWSIISLADERVASREEAGCYLPGSDPQQLLDAGDVEVVPAADDRSTGLARRGNVRCQVRKSKAPTGKRTTLLIEIRITQNGDKQLNYC